MIRSLRRAHRAWAWVLLLAGLAGLVAALAVRPGPAAPAPFGSAAAR